MRYMEPARSIVVSYAVDDLDKATLLKDVLVDRFGNDVWMKDFDLNGGDVVSNVLNDVIGEARWFILIISNASINSQWIKFEANLATIRAIESNEFAFVVIKTEECVYPNHLEIALKTHTVVDLTNVKDVHGEYMALALTTRLSLCLASEPFFAAE